VRLAAIELAVTSRDAIALRSAAHALKGSAGNLSAVGLFEAAGALEKIGAEGQLEGADNAWRHLSLQAASVVEELRRYSAFAKEPFPCAS
jgi:two-component system, sensor histidine kinase and response regulator